MAAAVAILNFFSIEMPGFSRAMASAISERLVFCLGVILATAHHPGKDHADSDDNGDTDGDERSGFKMD